MPDLLPQLWKGHGSDWLLIKSGCIALSPMPINLLLLVGFSTVCSLL
jgi:hypothetical protein